MRHLFLACVIVVALAGPARAGSAPVVVELFTSQGCSSCPPADAVLADLARTRPDVLPLGLHITYWDRLGWRDPFALPAATERQRAYSALWGGATIYTPQLVAGGRHQVIGSDRAAVDRAIAAARADASTVDVRVSGTQDLVVAAGAGPGRGTVWVVGYDPVQTTAVRAGENAGRRLTEANVVRALIPAGAWNGVATEWRLPRPAGERTAAMLQAADGRIIGAALLAGGAP